MPWLLLLLLGGGLLAAGGSTPSGAKPAPTGGGAPPVKQPASPITGLAGSTLKLVVGPAGASAPKAPESGAGAVHVGGALGAAIGAANAGWTPLVQSQAALFKSKPSLAKTRPAANAQPSDVKTWLDANNVFPLFAFPEWGWTVNGNEATASYSLANNDQVTWTADNAGNWHYDHAWGGFNVGQVLNAIASALAIVADASGLVFAGMFIHLLQAAANKEGLSGLATALKQDWDAIDTDEQNVGLAFAVASGDWEKAWNLATNYGTDMTAIIEAFGGTAPDINGVLNVTKSTVTTTAQGAAAADNALSLFS